jgi:hypothetical protein
VRYINREDLTIPSGWSEKARKALTEVRNAAPEERANVIEKNSEIWRDLKVRLRRMSHGKCWYCEAKIEQGDVDHFRPKNKVSEAPDHEGYWWLAFDTDNFRYSCPFCNRPNQDKILVDEYNDDGESEEDEEKNDTGNTETESCIPERALIKGSKGGKGTHFPLYPGTKRAYNEADRSVLMREMPLLLDPTVATDTMLLSFDDEGLAHPTRNQKRFPREYLRAEESIKIYHLNREWLKRRREVDVCNKVKYWYAEAKNNWLLENEAIETNQDDSQAHRAYQKAVEELCKLINERHEFSAAAKAILVRYRDNDNLWLVEVLDAC